MYLLQRYLLIKYGSESKMNEKFTEFMDILLDIETIYELHKKSSVEIKKFLSPLVREVLDV